MRVPSADVSKSDFDADVGFDQLRDLEQRIAERRARIGRAVCGLILLRVRLLQHLDRFEGFLARAVQRIAEACRVKLLEPLCDLTVSLSRPYAEVRDVGHRE